MDSIKSNFDTDANYLNKYNLSKNDCARSISKVFNFPTKDYLRENCRLIDKVFPIFSSEYEAYNMIINNCYLFKTDCWDCLSYSYLLQVLNHSWKCKKINVVKVKFMLNSHELYLINSRIIDSVIWFVDKFDVLKRLYTNHMTFKWKTWDNLSFITIINILDFCGKFQWVNTASLKVEVSAYLFYIDRNWDFTKLILEKLWKNYTKKELVDFLNKSYREKNSIWKSTKTWLPVWDSYRFRIVNYIVNDMMSL